jgi:hypothetical protein
MSNLISNWVADRKVGSSIIGAIALYVVARYSGSNSLVKLPSMLGGMEIPVALLGGVLGLSTSLVVDTISDTIMSHIPISEKFKNMESIVLHVLVGGASFSIIPYLLYSFSGEGNRINRNILMMFAAAGVGTEIVSQIISIYLKPTGGHLEPTYAFK